jgi:hypothetical protein
MSHIIGCFSFFIVITTRCINDVAMTLVHSHNSINLNYTLHYSTKTFSQVTQSLTFIIIPWKFMCI